MQALLVFLFVTLVLTNAFVAKTNVIGKYRYIYAYINTFILTLTVTTHDQNAYIARTATKSSLQMSSYWEGKAPPSSVLGIGAGIPSAVYGPLSLVALAVGTYCVHESNIFHQLSDTNFNAGYILGAQLVPISWGMHVAAYIQKQNKK